MGEAEDIECMCVAYVIASNVMWGNYDGNNSWLTINTHTDGSTALCNEMFLSSRTHSTIHNTWHFKYLCTGQTQGRIKAQGQLG